MRLVIARRSQEYDVAIQKKNIVLPKFFVARFR